MWHRLVSNKLLRRSSGTGCFVADFPASEEFIQVTSSNPPASSNNSSTSQGSTINYNLFVSTWNVGGVPPSDELDLEDWFDTRGNSYDIYVLGFQEIIPLSAKNVLGAEKNRIATKWNSLIRTALNKPIVNPQGNGDTSLGEKQKIYPDKVGGSSKGSITQDFQCLLSKQMVGILISVWVRSDLLCHIRHPNVSCIGCGVMGFLGNKGAVSVRFWLHETSFCFVCCHLASGGKEGDEMHRNSDAMEIFSRTSFPSGPCLDLPQKILDHDRILLLGDLNYRISLSDAKTRSLVERKEWNILLENDQLKMEVYEGRVFEGWQEGAISFSPTYKYYPNSDEYYRHGQGRKGEKRRSPAWCDRILWHGKGFKQYRYERCESRLSDHRPVRAIFTVEVEV
ncbi:putative endonuclease/exonuclease/phosphatase [Dioscorea sansibarensis]